MVGRKGLLVVTLIFVTLILASSAPASSQGLGDAVTVGADRDSLRLKPDQTGRVLLDVRNTANVTQWVEVDLYFMETSGHSIGMIEPGLFPLAPGEACRVAVDVTSHARLLQEHGHSDVQVRVVWGNGTRDGSVASPVGEWSRQFDVVDVFTMQLALLAVVIAAIVAAVGLLLRRRL